MLSFINDLNLKIKKNGLDLGCKTYDSLFYKFVDIKNCKITFCDINPSENVIRVDLNQKFEIDSDTYSFAFLFEVLEHLTNPQKK